MHSQSLHLKLSLVVVKFGRAMCDSLGSGRGHWLVFSPSLSY